MECRKCGPTTSAFYVKDRSTGRLDTTCKACRIKANNATSFKQLHTVAGKKRQNRNLIAELKKGPCQDCGGSFPSVCMDFDHRDPARKTRGVSAMAGQSQDAILREVEKCDLVCANCHRIRTAKARGYFL